MKVEQRPCDPGMKGCVLFGRFSWSNEEKNRPAKGPTTDREQASE